MWPVAHVEFRIVDEAGRAVHHVGQTVRADQELVATSRHGVVAIGQVRAVGGRERAGTCKQNKLCWHFILVLLLLTFTTAFFVFRKRIESNRTGPALLARRTGIVLLAVA